VKIIIIDPIKADARWVHVPIFRGYRALDIILFKNKRTAEAEYKYLFTINIFTIWIYNYIILCIHYNTYKYEKKEG